MAGNEKLPPLSGSAPNFQKVQQSQCYTSSSQPPFRQTRSEIFFFYGSLMDPSTLAKALHRQERPKLKPASITGYHYMLWGSYPALLEGPFGGKVEGAAFELQSIEELKRLREYEGKNYTPSVCRIQLNDGSSVMGKTFLWRANLEELRSGVFDLRDFQMNRFEMSLLSQRDQR